MTSTRIVIGLFARLIFWVMVFLVVGNAVAQALSDGSIFGALMAVVLFPLTFLVYPFISPEGASAWPMADGFSLILFLAIGAIAYPISTFIGGLEPT